MHTYEHTQYEHFLVVIGLCENKVRPLLREATTKAVLFSVITFHIYDRTSVKHKEQSTNNYNSW